MTADLPIAVNCPPNSADITPELSTLLVGYWSGTDTKNTSEHYRTGSLINTSLRLNESFFFFSSLSPEVLRSETGIQNALFETSSPLAPRYGCDRFCDS